jgi:hypothetical protein
MKNEMKRTPKKSETVFSRVISVAEQSAREANERYHNWTKASLTLGATLALALPLISALPISLPTTDTEPGGTKSTTTVHQLVVDPAKVAAVAEKAADAAMADVAEVAAKAAVAAVAEMAEIGDLSAIAEAINNLEGGSKNITMVPPVIYDVTWATEIPRNWHRTIFSQAGDEFWALPDASFILRLDSSIPNGQCNKTNCTAAFNLSAENYLATGLIENAIVSNTACTGRRCLTIDNRLAVRQNAIPAATACKKLTGPLIEEYVCRFVHTAGVVHLDNDPDSKDLCVWFRRSQIPEETDAYQDVDHIALDIRWQRIEMHDLPNQPAETCPTWNQAEAI